MSKTKKAKAKPQTAQPAPSKELSAEELDGVAGGCCNGQHLAVDNASPMTVENIGSQSSGAGSGKSTFNPLQ